MTLISYKSDFSADDLRALVKLLIKGKAKREVEDQIAEDILEAHKTKNLDPNTLDLIITKWNVKVK